MGKIKDFSNNLLVKRKLKLNFTLYQ
jgi:hypothetical protein